MQRSGSKLVRVMMADGKGGKTAYVGYFDDGGIRVIRSSHRAYKSVAQLSKHQYSVDTAPEEFLFSAKPSVALGAAQQPRLVSAVQVEAE
jgi:hypothetical protein